MMFNVRATGKLFRSTARPDEHSQPMRQSGFAPIELPAALVLFGLLAAGLLYLVGTKFPWYYYLFVVVGPFLLIFGSLFVMGVIAELFRGEQ